MRYKDSVKLYSMVTREIGIDFTIYNRDCKLLSFPPEIAYINLTLIKLGSPCIEPVHNSHQLLLLVPFGQRSLDIIERRHNTVTTACLYSTPSRSH